MIVQPVLPVRFKLCVALPTSIRQGVRSVITVDVYIENSGFVVLPTGPIGWSVVVPIQDGLCLLG